MAKNKSKQHRSGLFTDGRPVGTGTWQAVAVGMPIGLMISVVLGVTGIRPAPMVIVGASVVAVIAITVFVLVVGLRGGHDAV
jgi:hypothetical protein